MGLEELEFSKDGIFFQTNLDEWVEVSQILHDSNGYYLAGIFDFFTKPYIAICKNCETEYVCRKPQPCEHCDREDGFEFDFLEDDCWDRG